MEYIDIEFYKSLYGEIEAVRFNRLSFEACRVIDRHTTGADGVKKLRIAFPIAENDAELVKRCAANILNYLSLIEDTEHAVSASRGYEETAEGLRRKIVSRIESGNEAISYSEVPSTITTSTDKAAADRGEREKLLANVVREYLSGVKDSNGVNLLYMGPYPRRV